MNNPQESRRRFSGLLRRMLDQMPTLVEFFGVFVSLVLQLPAAQLHGMWPFLLAVRATADEAL